jgi:uncharacterized protein (TIGR03067 family)
MTDQEMIQGMWTLVSGHRHGNAFPEEVTKHVRLIFAGNKLTTMNKDRGTDFAFTLHPDQMPKGIDMDMQGHIGQGIYNLEGDSLKIIHGEVGSPRPTAFDGTGASGLTLLVLQRARP